jgi:hypothetical protein
MVWLRYLCRRGCTANAEPVACATVGPTLRIRGGRRKRHDVRGHSSMESLILASLVGLCWGITNTLIRKGVLDCAARSRVPRWLQQVVGSHWASLLLSKTFVGAQLLNWTGSLVLLLSLGSASLHIATPVANAVCVAATALSSSWILSDRYKPSFLIAGVLLTCAGAALVSL